MIVCIDSQIIIWGIKKQPTTGQEDMVGQAEDFFKWADNSGHEIIIPTVVIAEVLAPEPEEIRAHYLEVIQKHFVIVNFDNRAALKYAQLLHKRFDEVKRIASESGTLRQKMKMDHIIIATALVNNANCIYSYDRALKAFGSGFIDVKEFPLKPPKIKGLFDDLPL